MGGIQMTIGNGIDQTTHATNVTVVVDSRAAREREANSEEVTRTAKAVQDLGSRGRKVRLSHILHFV